VFKKNVAASVPFILVNSVTGAALTGATVSGFRTLDNGAQAGVTGTITEKGNGQYHLAAAAGDLNGDTVGLLFTASGAIPVGVAIRTTTKLISELQDLTAAQVNTEADTALLDVGLTTTITGRIDAAVSTRAPASTALSSATWTTPRAVALDNLDATVSSRSTYAGGDTAGTTTLLARLTSTRAGLLDNLDAAITTRLSTAAYTAPDNATISAIASYLDTEIAAIKARTDTLPADPASETTVLTRLAAADYTVPPTVEEIGDAVGSDSKEGYKLASDGLDLIATAPPIGATMNFREMQVMSYRRLFKHHKVIKTDTGAGDLKTYADDNVTVITTQAVTDTGTVLTHGAATDGP
jgi:hypothetical protein